MTYRKGIGLLWRLLLLSVVASSSSVAQATPRAGLVGTVRDTGGTPVSLARLSTSGILSISDSAGRFSLAGLSPGNAKLLVRRLGFEPVDIAVQLVAGRSDSLNVVLTLLPQDLPGVTTRADAIAEIQLASFYRHRHAGIGHFLDRKEIEERRVQRLSDILRRIPGMRLTPDRMGSRSTLRSGRSAGGRDCPPDMWIDGVRAPGLNIDDVPVGDVEALEVYGGPAGLPPEMNSRLGNPSCGVVVIWTRLPG
jgi:hypothetical protein